MLELTWLEEDNLGFPPVSKALQEPNGLLAVGGDLRPERIVTAYKNGIFPWYGKNDPILWWSPSPRLVLFPEKFHLSRSLKKSIKKGHFHITTNQAFREVMTHCASPRDYTSETWITPEMLDAYCNLHLLGYAHSVEAWQDNELVGGLYGIQLGKVFFGESMFSRATDASKVAFSYAVDYLRQLDCRMIDCQVSSEHLISLGAEEIDRKNFIAYLEKWITTLKPGPRWQFNQLDS